MSEPATRKTAERVLLEQLQELERKWRISSQQCNASRLLDDGDMTLAAEAALVEAEAIYRECADDLAALLRALPQTVEPKGGDVSEQLSGRTSAGSIGASGGVTHPPTNTSPAPSGEAQKDLRQRSIELLRDTLSMLCNFIWTRQMRPGEHMWSIPVDRERDFYCIFSDAIDELVELRAGSMSAPPQETTLQQALANVRSELECARDSLDIADRLASVPSAPPQDAPQKG